MGQLKLYNKGTILIFFCTLFTTILYYRDFAVVDINKMYLVLLTFATAALLDYKHIVYLLSFLFPLSCGIPGNYIYPLLAILLFIKDNNRGFNKLFFFIVIFLFEILHYGAYSFDSQFAEVLGYASFIFLLSYIITDNSRDLDLSKCLTFFCIGTCVLFLGLVINTNILGEQIASTADGMRLGEIHELGDFKETRMMLSVNANVVGYYSIAAISCLLVLQYYKKIHSIFFFILFAIAFYAGLLSVSRTWFILLAVSFFTYLIFMKSSRIKGIFLIIALCIGAYIFLFQNAMIIDAYVERFVDDTNNLATAGGRTVIFQQYNEFLADNPIVLCFGTGAVYYMEVSGLKLATHNATQQILVSYGWVGLSIFIFALIRQIKKYFNRKELIAILPLLTMTLFIQSIQFLNPYFLIGPIIIAILSLKIGLSHS